MSYNIIIVVISFAYIFSFDTLFVTATNSTTNTYNSRPRALLTNSDAYLVRNQKQCLETRSIVSCIKYKASKIVWKLASNSLGYFPRQNSREMSEDKRRISFVQLEEPSDISFFGDVRSYEDDNEMNAFVKFLKRAVEYFGQNHAIQVTVSSDSGARIITSDKEPRRIIKRKARKTWMILLPLIILMKITHLKMTLVALILGVLALNILIVGGGGWLIHYLKFKTLCKIHPQLVHHHSHAYDSDPADYTQFVGSTFPGTSHGSSLSSNAHEILNPYYFSKDWSTSKAYRGYNYLDTISKRIQ
ncbi:osiris 1 [Musca autumnalis]|uniref:osiris 1 n=1 Tax=Musca autumnalis TaxID=221902 RepID=UPI003CEEBAC3